ncbi:TetR family transcriptional regulator [Longimycelium tulufanense]|uniref:TetR family transcriptional regulator n=1 Tax=Longimycelium tulufanense TaxID=907463 RepID=A0A8J3FXW5_9PSEU|nr:TetR/AcrR family transcriptional regulator [Longimycelium tulufanense]GGM71664.1 TetR family transcriptional regulator [Longimycelium tulufanense]
MSGARAERILDVAGDLLQRWGYKRVTIADVARVADVGKGTVYLHWRSKEDLFVTVLVRERLAVLAELVEAMRQDPGTVLLDRFTCAARVALTHRPIADAMYRNDFDTLGALARTGSEVMQESRRLSEEGIADHVRLLREHGLARTDLDLDAQLFAFSAVGVGFLVIDRFVIDDEQRELDWKLDVLGKTIRNAFGPVEKPEPDVLRAVAPRIRGIYQDQITRVDKLIRAQMGEDS